MGVNWPLLLAITFTLSLNDIKFWICDPLCIRPNTGMINAQMGQTIGHWAQYISSNQDIEGQKFNWRHSLDRASTGTNLFSFFLAHKSVCVILHHVNLVAGTRLLSYTVRQNSSFLNILHSIHTNFFSSVMVEALVYFKISAGTWIFFIILLSTMISVQ